MYKIIGKWWNDRDIELVEIEGKVYALSGWNGEIYGRCWECTGDGFMDASEKEYEIKPIYEEIGEDEFELVDYVVLHA